MLSEESGDGPTDGLITVDSASYTVTASSGLDIGIDLLRMSDDSVKIDCNVQDTSDEVEGSAEGTEREMIRLAIF